MTQVPSTCPECFQKLELKQINMNMAILMCLNLKCSYPVNEQCVLVHRRIEDIKKSIEHFIPTVNEEADLMEELEEILKTQNIPTELSNNVDINSSNLPNHLEMDSNMDDFLMDLLR
ncbi:uncharacterized protein LOC143202379 [Rhynchophorus ferrugineus]|uniref:Uncharacterized protein n=1 Tax=Rhynchophorus ferrugineus TaxID=354439 RepID=A0A834M910_RHYFE|nr:hypothetical protein GWI33_016116 [Rhynchophorus ferrugineus]